MKNYKRIFYWQNKFRLKKLEEYIEIMEKVYSDKFQSFDSDKKQAVFRQVNEKSNTIEEICNSSDKVGIYEQFGRIGSVISDWESLPPKFVKNYLYATKGAYMDNTNQSIRNTLNPFIYLSIFSDFLLTPVYDLFGVKEDKTMFWKSIKILVETIILILTFLFSNNLINNFF